MSVSVKVTFSASLTLYGTVISLDLRPAIDDSWTAELLRLWLVYHLEKAAA